MLHLSALENSAYPSNTSAGSWCWGGIRQGRGLNCCPERSYSAWTNSCTIWKPWQTIVHWLGPSVVPFYPFLGEDSPTTIDYRKQFGYPYSNLSNLEDLALFIGIYIGESIIRECHRWCRLPTHSMEDQATFGGLGDLNGNPFSLATEPPGSKPPKNEGT